MASQPRSAGAARSVIVPSAPDWDGPGDGTVGGMADGATGLAHAAATIATDATSRIVLRFIVSLCALARSALVLRAVSPGRHRPTTVGQDPRRGPPADRRPA